MATKTKRCFVSSISRYVKIRKENKEEEPTRDIEEILSQCYVETIIDMVNETYLNKCNGCDITFIEKMELFYPEVIEELKINNEIVLD